MMPLTVSTAERQVKNTNKARAPIAANSREILRLEAMTTMAIAVRMNTAPEAAFDRLLRKK